MARNNKKQSHHLRSRSEYGEQARERITQDDRREGNMTETVDDEMLNDDNLRRTAIQPTLEHGERYHEAGKRDVELYIRTYNTLLRSSGEVNLNALVQAHYNIDSSLHPDARKAHPDMSAFIYSVLRLPSVINQCERVLLGQSEEVFQQQGFPVDTWQAVTSSARRRKWFYDGEKTLAVYVASVSDTDDIVPILVAFQIEWNKMYYLLNDDPTTMQLLETDVEQGSPVFSEISKVLRHRLHIAHDDWERLEVIWGNRLWKKLHEIGEHKKSFHLRMLGGSHVGYVKATHQWWEPVKSLLDTLGLVDRPVYFVSSNTHSLVNLLSGFMKQHEQELVDFAKFRVDRCRGTGRIFCTSRRASGCRRGRVRRRHATGQARRKSEVSGMWGHGTDWRSTRKFLISPSYGL
jgi:hypothetical protein